MKKVLCALFGLTVFLIPTMPYAHPYLEIISTTVSDDFNDNIKNKTLWGPDDGDGKGVLTERNHRLEYTVSTPGALFDYSYRELIASQGTYTANWEAQIDFFNGTKTSGSKASSVGMEIFRCDNRDDLIYAELYAADGGKSFYAELDLAWVETVDLSGNLPLTGSMRISFDSLTKIITLDYDIGSGWVQFGSFGISDTGGGTDGNADWFMTDMDQFCFDVYGWSEEMTIGSGKIYADNFQVTGVTTPVSTRVLQPDGAEPVPAGDVYPVTWEAPLAATKFKLQYSIDNGTTWKPMAPDLVTGRSHDWQVPVPPNNKSKCLVKITGYNEDGVKIGTAVSARFTIEVLKLDAPNGGGEPLISLTQFPISWMTNHNVPLVHHVQLSYTLDNGVTWKAINTTADPSDDGSFLWTVPKVTNDKNNCKVKIVLKGASGKTLGSDVSDGVFTIQPSAWKIKMIDKVNAANLPIHAAIDANDAIHVLYDDFDNGLKYATNKSGTWVATTIFTDNVNTYHNAGFGIAVDGANKVHIVYTTSGGVVALYYRTDASGSWITTKLVDYTDNIYGYGFSGPAIAVTSNGKVHIAFGGGASDLFYLNDLSGAWIEPIKLGDIGFGVDASMALDLSGQVYIAQDNPYGLKLAVVDAAGTPVSNTLIDGEDVDYGPNRWYPAIAASKVDNSVYVSYWYWDTAPEPDVTLLKLWSSAGGITSIDDAPNGPESGITVDQNGKVHISYADPYTSKLKHATNESGTWVVEELPTEAGSDDSDILIDSTGKINVLYFNDATNSLSIISK